MVKRILHVKFFFKVWLDFQPKVVVATMVVAVTMVLYITMAEVIFVVLDGTMVSDGFNG